MNFSADTHAIFRVSLAEQLSITKLDY